MKFLLSGVETKNKGAELMLYAILQEIERKYPNSDVYIAPSAVSQGLDYVHTKIRLHYWPCEKLAKTTARLIGVIKKLHLPSKWLNDTYAAIVANAANAIKADYFFDASGFCFSDKTQMYGKSIKWWETILKHQFNNGCKIFFLPQAFGPIELEQTQKAIVLLGKYSTIIMPREQISYRYIKDSGLIDMSKVQLFSDFTSLVKGKVPSKYNYLSNGICIVPNNRMIDQGAISLEEYISLLRAIIERGRYLGYQTYLLNHEGIGDERLACIIKDKMGGDIEVVTRLNALETKGLISSAYLVVSSRFHGVASALNTCVPCLATSWSHKYKELFNDYKLENCILPLNNIKEAIKMIDDSILPSNNKRIRNQLLETNSIMECNTKKMWEMIWGK